MSLRVVLCNRLLFLVLTLVFWGHTHTVFAQEGLIHNVSQEDERIDDATTPKNPTLAIEPEESLIPNHSLFTSPVHEPPLALFDQEHLRLALRFEPTEGQIFGVAKIRIRPASDTLKSLQIAAQNLTIYSVQIGVLDSTKVESPYADSINGLLEISLDSLQVPGVPFEIQITYRASPEAGMHFERVKKSDKSHKIHIWTDGTVEGNSHWIPLLNNPADRLTSEIIATVPPGLDVLSNGRVVEQMETEDGMSLFHYLQEQSHPPGDIGLFIGRFSKSKQLIRLNNGLSIPIIQWLSDEAAEKAERALEEVPDILFYLSDKLDFSYPWATYSQLIFEDRYVKDMSFTSFTIFNDRILTDARASIDQSNTFRMASSIARQWFGHLTSTDHWSDVWLTESLSRYLGLLYIKSTKGDAAYFSLLHQLSKNYFNESKNYKRPLVWNQWHASYQLLDNHAFGKGVWLFHSLQEDLGEDQFWSFLQRFIKEQAFQTTNTDEMLASIQSQDERGARAVPFASFFDDWVYGAGHPEINLDYQYDIVSESLYVSVEQIQEGYLIPPVFNLELPLETYSLAGPARHHLSIKERDQLFAIPMSIQPRYVLLDPDKTLLSSTIVNQSANSWVSQLRYASHPLSQLQALEHLRDYVDDPALFIGLQNALRSRPIPLVRATIIELVSMLPHSDATKRLLLDTYEKDDEPLVRRAVLLGLEAFEEKADLIILAMEAAQSAKSYLLQAQAVATLVKINAPGASDILQSALITPSYKDIIRQTALRSVQYTSMSTRERVNLAIKYSNSKNAIEVRLAAIEILASLAKLGNKQSLLTLSKLVRDEDMIIRQTIVAYLGLIGDEASLEAMESQLARELEPLVQSSIIDAIDVLQTSLSASESP